ncbi:MAG: maleylpyruvate isomerase N-terminal domain-containing protein [Acidobacteriota bacterium]
MKTLEALDTRPLFQPLHRELLDLLQGFRDEDWVLPTVAGAWRVRDVVAHLLDVMARDVAVIRDGHLPPPDAEIRGYEDLVAFLDGLNADWVRAARRLSPRLLVDLLDLVGQQAVEVLESQPLEGEATFAVDWAGVDESRQWMHVGRQYTEYWHHQMQLRDAVGAPRLLEARWLKPLLDLSVRALPRTYSGVEAPAGTTVTLLVAGDGVEAERGEEAGEELGAWTLRGEADGWSLWEGAPNAPTTTVRLTADESWRLLYNARSPEESRQRAQIFGEAGWSEPLWRARSVMVRAPKD